MAVMLKEVIHREDKTLFKDGIKMSKKKKRKRNFNDDKIIFHGNPSLPRKRKPYKEYKDFDDNDDYEVDFYEDKNYEYIDQDQVESLMHQNIVNNHKMGLAFKESDKGLNYNFSPLDYNNYDYEEIGNLNFRGDWTHHQLDDSMRYRRRRYNPKNKIFFSKRKLRKCLKNRSQIFKNLLFLSNKIFINLT